MCEFCEKEDEIIEINRKEIDFGMFGTAILSTDISDGQLYSNLTFIDSSIEGIEIKKKINFCPICGRKLNGE